MKKLCVLLITLQIAFPTWANSKTILNCVINNSDSEINLTIGQDNNPNGFGLYAFINQKENWFATEIRSNLKWRDFSRNYMPENFLISGVDFLLSYDDFSNAYHFNGEILDSSINQEIRCYQSYR